MQLHLPPFQDELAAVDARLLVLSFAELPRFQHWVPYFRRKFLEPYYQEQSRSLPPDPFARTRFAADPTLSVYHAYGLGRNSALHVYGPQILWQYLVWGIQGKPIKKVEEDPLQRGGNFVVGFDGKLTFSHTGRDQRDRPSASEILEALHRGSTQERTSLRP